MSATAPAVAQTGSLFPVDNKEFWEINARCLGRFDVNKPRTPLSFSIGEDFIKWRMDVTDHPRFYLDCDYQQQTRLACGKLTREHIGGLVVCTAGGICAGSWEHLRAFMAAVIDCGSPAQIRGGA